MGGCACRNIILIGMPGSGKSHLARLIAERTGRLFLDTDEEVVARVGMPIEAIFAKHGEPWFRRVEAEAVADCAARRSAVIATGGGVVLSAENRRVLRRSGVVALVMRALSCLDREGRPLSKSLAALEVMYKERLPLYRLLSDVALDLGNAPLVDYDAAADEVLRLLAAREMMA